MNHENQERTTWETYVSAWRHPSRHAKAAALAASAMPDCIYTDPLAHTEGHQALVEYMLSFQQQVPGAHFETTYFLAHHARSVARWNMRSADGAVLGDGISYGEYNADGKLVAMTGFFEVPKP